MRGWVGAAAAAVAAEGCVGVTPGVKTNVLLSVPVQKCALFLAEPFNPTMYVPFFSYKRQG